MKPEYTLRAESEESKNKIVEGLIASQYILSVKRYLVGGFEISIYGKEKTNIGGSLTNTGVTSTSPGIVKSTTMGDISVTGSTRAQSKEDTFWIENNAPMRYLKNSASISTEL